MRKSGKRPTRKQKERIAANGLRPENWLVRSDTPSKMEILDRLTGKPRIIWKAG